MFKAVNSLGLNLHNRPENQALVNWKLFGMITKANMRQEQKIKIKIFPAGI